MTRSALIRDAARCSRDEGTQWRDRLERWLKGGFNHRGIHFVIPAHYQVDFSDDWHEIAAKQSLRFRN
jgi:hypothetical protein